MDALEKKNGQLQCLLQEVNANLVSRMITAVQESLHL